MLPLTVKPSPTLSPWQPRTLLHPFSKMSYKLVFLSLSACSQRIPSFHQCRIFLKHISALDLEKSLISLSFHFLVTGQEYKMISLKNSNTFYEGWLLTKTLCLANFFFFFGDKQNKSFIFLDTHGKSYCPANLSD